MNVTPTIDALNTLGGLAMCAAYAGMISAGRSDKAFGVPLGVALLYASWDLCWQIETVRMLRLIGFKHVFLAVYLLWPILSLPLFVMVVREKAGSYAKGMGGFGLVAGSGAALAMTAGALAAAGAEIGFYVGLIVIGYMLAMAISAMFLADLAARQDARGARLSIVALRGTAVQLFVAGDVLAGISPLPVAAGLVCGVLDVLYGRQLLVIQARRY